LLRSRAVAFQPAAAWDCCKRASITHAAQYRLDCYNPCLHLLLLLLTAAALLPVMQELLR
jgi:hypothetical protein